MHLYIYSFILGSYYLCYGIMHKYLANYYDFDKIIINVFFILAILSLIILTPKKIITPIDLMYNPDPNYIIIILMALSMFIGAYTWSKAAKTNHNLGIIEGVAMAWYLPVLLGAMVVMFNQKVSYRNIIGIITLGIGGYLTLS